MEKDLGCLYTIRVFLFWIFVSICVEVLIIKMTVENYIIRI